MPPDHSRRFNEYQGIEEFVPQSVKQDPEQTVGKEEPKAAGTLPPENNNLMSQSDELKLQRCAAADADAEREMLWGRRRGCGTIVAV
jgi:hypothetical protein